MRKHSKRAKPECRLTQMRIIDKRKLVNSRKRMNGQQNKVEHLSDNAERDGHNFSDNGEFDPGSGRTLAACFIHASRTRISSLLERKVADG